MEAAVRCITGTVEKWEVENREARRLVIRKLRDLLLRTSSFLRMRVSSVPNATRRLHRDKNLVVSDLSEESGKEKGETLSRVSILNFIMVSWSHGPSVCL
jgi:hypothetical protein